MKQRYSELTLAVKGKSGDERYVDYIMSKEYGLDWKKYDFRRMHEFILIKQIENQLNNTKKHGNDPARTRNNSKRYK